MAKLQYWLWLTTRRRLGLQGMHCVIEQFGSPERAYFADPAEYRLLPPNVADALRDRSMDEAERIAAACEKRGVRILTVQDAAYPERLRQLYDAPLLLYLKGTLTDLDEQVTVGVVGTRKATPYGRDIAGRLGRDLALGGATLVSGIAVGIDACAVRGALQVGGAPVCVLAGGVDVPYPREHWELYDQVAEAGLLVSEYPPGTANKAEHFPIRNRIISGLSMGVVVVEAREHGSGAMITAAHALEQDRDVFAVPGNVDAENSRGCIRLIQQGAKPVLNAEDVLTEYRGVYWAKLNRQVDRLRQGKQGPSRAEPATSAPVEMRNEDPPLEERGTRGLTDDEISVLYALADGPCQADEVVERTQIPTQRVLTALTMLQIAGCIGEKPGRRFVCLVKLKQE